jgi:hypothetical protein
MRTPRPRTLVLALAALAGTSAAVTYGRRTQAGARARAAAEDFLASLPHQAEPVVLRSSQIKDRYTTEIIRNQDTEIIELEVTCTDCHEGPNHIVWNSGSSDDVVVYDGIPTWDPANEFSAIATHDAEHHQ